jgi:ATP-dependent Clp protease ATP-binding subunit ClpA
LFEERPEAPGRRRIVEACGMDPDAILAERDARPVAPPEIHPMVREALELAGDDAARLGQGDIRPENLFVGLLRCTANLSHYIIKLSGADLERFRADFAERILPSSERLQRTALVLHPDSQALVQESSTLTTERRSDLVNVYSLLFALTRKGHGVVPDLLARYGGNVAPLNTQLERSL